MNNFEKFIGALLMLACANMHVHAMKYSSSGSVPFTVQNSISPGGIHADIDQQQKDLNNRLLVAVIDQRVDKAVLLLQRGADVNFRSVQRRTPLMQAALEGDYQMCKMLIAQGADINALGPFGYTALLYAVSKRHGLVVQVLVTAIPPSAHQRILHLRAQIITGQLALKQQNLVPQKDVRKLITRPLLDELLDEQMERIDAMLAARNTYGENAYDIAKRKRFVEIATLLDPCNEESRNAIRVQLEQNVWHILSADGKSR